MGAILRAILAWTVTFFYWPAAILAYPFLRLVMIRTRLVKAMIRGWGQACLSVLGIEVEFVNPSTIETQESRVVVCNHQSALDLLWGAILCPPAPIAIGKKELIYVPVLNLVWFMLGFIRVDRKNPTRAIASLRGVSQKILSEKLTLLIAPEGTRTSDGSFLPFKKGAFHIAIQSQVPIYPIVIDGAFDLLPKRAYFPKRGKVWVQFLPPESTRGLTIESVDELTTRVRQRMLEAYEKLRKRSNAASNSP